MWVKFDIMEPNYINIKILIFEIVTERLNGVSPAFHELLCLNISTPILMIQTKLGVLES